MTDELQSQPIATETMPPEAEITAIRRKKPIVLGLVSILLIVIIGGGVIYFFRNKIGLPGRPVPLPRVMEKIENGRARCTAARDKEKCLSELTLDEAVAGKQVAACEKVADASLRDGCYDTIARELGDEKMCTRVSLPAAADDCAGAIIFAKSKKSDDMALCAAIASPRWQDGCYRFIWSERGTRELCETAGDKRDQCLNFIITSEAAGSGEPALCAEISVEEERVACEELASEAAAETASARDDDGDGLTNAEEARYGTNPNNPDTDGDGFKDGDEVKAGYNPKGPGRL
ncbi:hypothetical protein HYT45_00600 [Candidatus Uhrbacteria bacterium]|nr:hypothetical protein [Candidatus Uhrbacteria bacterium]